MRASISQIRASLSAHTNQYDIDYIMVGQTNVTIYNLMN